MNKIEQKVIERNVGISRIPQTTSTGITMPYPKIHSAIPVDDHTLLIVFDNKKDKKYDITPLLSKEMFKPLKNPALFKSVQVEKGGYAVVWNDSIDISEYELWCHGQVMS